MSFCARCSAINRGASSSICVTTRSREGGISCASRNNSGVLGGTHIKRPGHPGPGEPWFCVAGIWRTDKDVGEAFTMIVDSAPDLAAIKKAVAALNSTLLVEPSA